MQRFTLSLLLLVALLMAAPAIAQTCTVTWTNATGGDWNNGSNWSSSSVPGPADDACVTLAGTYTVSHTSGAAIDVNSLTFGAASGTQTLDTSQGIVLASASTIAANGVMEWSDGFLSGGATLTTVGDVVLDGINFNSRGVLGSGSVLRTESDVRWTSDEFTLRDGGIWEHTGTLTATLGGSTELRQDGLAGNLFDNTGTVNVTAGTLDLRTDARHDGAVLSAETGAELDLSAGTHTFAGTTTGAPDGDVILSAGSAAEAGAVWNLSGEGLQWRDGYLGAGTLTNDGLVVLNGTNFNTRGVDSLGVFVNDANVRWEREEFTLFDGGTWTNNGTITAALTVSSAQLRRGGLAGESFDNTGTVSVTAGTLNLGIDARHDGAVLSAETGAELDLSAGTHTFAGTTTGAPAGDVVLSTTSQAEAGAAWNLSGEGLQWQSGYLEAGMLTNDGLVVLNGTNFNTRGVSGAATEFVNAGDVRWEREEFTLLDGGTWINTGTITAPLSTASAQLRRGGTGAELFDNSGTVRAEANTLFIRVDARYENATLTADAGATLSLDDGTHTLAGTTTGAPDGNVILGASSVAEAGATWNLSGAGLQWQSGYLEAGMLTNDGLVVLNGTNFNTRGVSGAATEFVNAGDVRWEREEFTLLDGGTWTNTGLLTIDAVTSSVQLRRGGTGAELFDNIGVVSVDTSQFNVDVVFNHQTGALIQGTDTFDIRGSTFTQNGDTGPGTSPGLLTWQNDWAPSSGSTLFIELGGTTPGDDYDQLAVAGRATLAGMLDLSIAVGDAPGIGDTFTVLTAAGGVTGTFDAVQPAFGYTFDVTYNTNDVEVEVLTVPNFDLVAVNTDPTGDPIVVAKPGAIGFSYAVTNNTNAPITGDVFFTASLGTTTLAQGTILSGTLPANSSSPTLSYTQGVPGIAPVGTYTYSIKIGQFPNVVVDQVDFTVQVVSGGRNAQAIAGDEWLTHEATPWMATDGTVLMSAPEPTEAIRAAEAASAALPETFGLASAYPNPFRSSTTFTLDVPEAGQVTVVAYDALGRRVAVLLDEEVEAGTHRVPLNVSNLPSGVYLVRAAGVGATAMQRVTLVR